MADHGTFYWNELLTNDVDKACEFYTSMLGWSTEEMPMPDGKYIIVKSANGPAAGIMDLAATMAPDRPPHWFSYIAVDDVDAVVAKATSSGGTIHAEPFDVPGVGRIAVIGDPTGAPIGVMTAAPQE